MENNVIYEFIINNINNLLTQGINYYDTKDEKLKMKLISIQEFINDNQEKPIDNLKKDDKLDNLPQIEKLASDFINKMLDLKISVLNKEPSKKIIEPPKEDKPFIKVSSFSSLLNQFELDNNSDNEPKNVTNDSLIKDDLFDELDFDIHFDFDDVKPSTKKNNLETVSNVDNVENHTKSSILDVFQKKE